MATTTIPKRSDDPNVVFDWRFAELRRAGYGPNDAWLLASNRDVDLRLAERLLAQGCARETVLQILL
jgi:hypothetical protein